jgi:hypothetical protein
LQLSTILETSCPQITQEPDWTDFMIDELLSVETIETPIALYNLLGTLPMTLMLVSNSKFRFVLLV